jgi:signal peptidase
MNILKKTLSVFASVVLWAIILLAALYAFTTLATRDDSHVASLAGFTPMVVESDSMLPTFASGDLIIVKSCDPATLEEGDIITFHTIINNEYSLNTHRIESIIEDNGVRSYVTKGDNNEISDTHIIADGDIVGKYVGKLAKVGSVMEVLSSSLGFLLIIVLPMVLFFIYQVYHLIMVSIQLKKAVAAEEAAAQAAAEGASGEDTAAILAEAQRLKAEAEAALAEAQRLQGAAKADPPTQAEKSGEAAEPAQTEETAPMEETAQTDQPAQTEDNGAD